MTPPEIDVSSPLRAHVSSSGPRTRPGTVSQVLESGVRFGKYQVLRLLRRGGMSEVYEALHLGLRKRVALKIMSPELAAEAGALERFVAEGENAVRVRHPHVVDVTDVGVHDGLAFLVMALLEGEELTALYRRAAPLPVSTVVDLLLPIASAVAHGHARGVIHRDLKPENVFLHQEGGRIVPTLLDFGVSVSKHRRISSEGTGVYGTPRYMSPEQARGEPAIDARTDQYALAVMLYEGITGRLPHDGSDPIELLRAVACDPFLPPSHFVELPVDFEQVLLRALARQPEERFETTRELASALLPYAGDDTQRGWAHELSPSGRFSAPGLPAARPSAAPAQVERALPTLQLDMVAAFRPQPMPPRLLAGTAVLSLLLLVGVVAHLGQQRAQGRGAHMRVDAAPQRPVAEAPTSYPERSATVLRDGQRVAVDRYVPRVGPPSRSDLATAAQPEAGGSAHPVRAAVGKIVEARPSDTSELTRAAAKAMAATRPAAKKVGSPELGAASPPAREQVALAGEAFQATAPVASERAELSELGSRADDPLAPSAEQRERFDVSLAAPAVRVIAERTPKVRLVE